MLLKWNSNFQIPCSGRQFAEVYIKCTDVLFDDSSMFLRIAFYSDLECTDEVSKTEILVPEDALTVNATDIEVIQYLKTVYTDSTILA